MIFRGTTKDGKVVEGWLCIWQGVVYIFDSPFNLYNGRHEVLPQSLAMSTGISDKNKVPIYGSFEYEPGKLSEGGDMVKSWYPCGHLQAENLKVEFVNGKFRATNGYRHSDFLNVEVIPKEKQ